MTACLVVLAAWAGTSVVLALVLGAALRLRDQHERTDTAPGGRTVPVHTPAQTPVQSPVQSPVQAPAPRPRVAPAPRSPSSTSRPSAPERPGSGPARAGVLAG